MQATSPQAPKRDHGGGVDGAIACFGGQRSDWIDLSTGINPVPYPLGQVPASAWGALPDQAASDALLAAARALWQVPKDAAILAAPGASALIARLPALRPKGRVVIEGPTYNEHAAGFQAAGWQVQTTHAPGPATARVIVHPNNPTGQWHSDFTPDTDFSVIDESFCDVAPNRSLLPRLDLQKSLVLKSFGKFWGLAGLRLGFAIGNRADIAKLAQMLGPWPVSGPAMHIGARALADHDWAKATRARLAADAARMDGEMAAQNAVPLGGTTLFRLYQVGDALAWQAHLARAHIWSRVFPYAGNWLRLGLPAPKAWPRVSAAIASATAKDVR